MGNNDYCIHAIMILSTTCIHSHCSLITPVAAPEVTIAEVGLAVPGDNVTLTCSATGDTPFTYQWTMQGSADVINSDNSTGTLELLNIAESQIGTYICTVSNAVGEGVSNITIEQASKSILECQRYAGVQIIYDTLLLKPMQLLLSHLLMKVLVLWRERL